MQTQRKAAFKLRPSDEKFIKTAKEIEEKKIGDGNSEADLRRFFEKYSSEQEKIEFACYIISYLIDEECSFAVKWIFDNYITDAKQKRRVYLYSQDKKVFLDACTNNFSKLITDLDKIKDEFEQLLTRRDPDQLIGFFDKLPNENKYLVFKAFTSQIFDCAAALTGDFGAERWEETAPLGRRIYQYFFEYYKQLPVENFVWSAEEKAFSEDLRWGHLCGDNQNLSLKDRLLCLNRYRIHVYNACEEKNPDDSRLITTYFAWQFDLLYSGNVKKVEKVASAGAQEIKQNNHQASLSSSALFSSPAAAGGPAFATEGVAPTKGVAVGQLDASAQPSSSSDVLSSMARLKNDKNLLARKVFLEQLQAKINDMDNLYNPLNWVVSNEFSWLQKIALSGLSRKLSALSFDASERKIVEVIEEWKKEKPMVDPARPPISLDFYQHNHWELVCAHRQPDWMSFFTQQVKTIVTGTPAMIEEYVKTLSAVDALSKVMTPAKSSP